MRVVVVIGALFSVSLSGGVGCVAERTYMDPALQATMGDAWGGMEGNGSALLIGDVGELLDIDNRSTDMFVTREPSVVEFSGNVPHQAQTGSSVFLDVRILNPERLPMNTELRQQGIVDTWDTDANQTEPALDVYICPNGEGVSGNADDIVVTRTGTNTFLFEALSTRVQQNLNVNLELEEFQPAR